METVMQNRTAVANAEPVVDFPSDTRARARPGPIPRVFWVCNFVTK